MKERAPYTKIGQMPKVEELDLALQIPISDAMSNWKKRENFSGFWRAYLGGEDEKLFMARHWDALENVLALLVYGLVLFLTFKGFINSAAISIFWAIGKEKQSIVSMFLEDTFHMLNTIHKKKSGTLICCLLLLYNWLVSHVFKLNSLVDAMTGGDLAKTLVSLSSKDVTWYRNKLNVEEIIINCRSFPNVPLIGSKGLCWLYDNLDTLCVGNLMIGN